MPSCLRGEAFDLPDQIYCSIILEKYNRGRPCGHFVNKKFYVRLLRPDGLAMTDTVRVFETKTPAELSTDGSSLS